MIAHGDFLCQSRLHEARQLQLLLHMQPYSASHACSPTFLLLPLLNC